MSKVGFITCSDLSRYFPSAKDPLLTHDDQVASDFLQSRGLDVEPVIWGTPIAAIESKQFDLLVVRSPWDYMDTAAKSQGFFSWLWELHARGIQVKNSVDVLRWNLDKHYLQELARAGIQIVSTEFLEPSDSTEKLGLALKRWGRIVVKPCIAAAAKDAYLVESEQCLAAFVDVFQKIRGDRSFMIQPFIEEIKTQGEWSIIFLNGQLSHAVHKLPMPGNWLVQDELGGSVKSDDAPWEVSAFAVDVYERLRVVLKKMHSSDDELLYARVDILPGLRVGELELVEPELFFLDRRTNEPNWGALEKFFAGIQRLLRHRESGIRTTARMLNF